MKRSSEFASLRLSRSIPNPIFAPPRSPGAGKLSDALGCYRRRARPDLTSPESEIDGAAGSASGLVLSKIRRPASRSSAIPAYRPAPARSPRRRVDLTRNNLTLRYCLPMQADGAARCEFTRGPRTGEAPRLSRLLSRPTPARSARVLSSRKAIDTLPALRYGSGHRKRGFKNPIRQITSRAFSGILNKKPSMY